MRTLDRIVRFDERSRNYRSVEGIEDKPLKSMSWGCFTWNDQGREGACVGFGWSHELAAKPKVYPTDNTFAQSLYHRAQQLDSTPGENYEGTSVLAGAKAVSELINPKTKKPYLSGYTWAFGTEDILRTIGYKGPVVLGINWYNDMYDADANGYLHATGGIAGGHCILANKSRLVFKDKQGPKTYDNLDLIRSYVTLHNSWGIGWGQQGEAKITVYDLNYIIKQDGDACKPVKI